MSERITQTWMTLIAEPAETVRGGGVDTEAGVAAERAVEALEDEKDTLEFGATLGQGAMGLVRVAMQKRVGRKVAVKTLKDGLNVRSASKLLQEAWVTAALEHPNIVPVYDVAMDGALPQIVMKRIEGTEWETLLRDPELLEPEYRADPVVWHLGVLLSVCNAVEFAHARGIVHRDLKPENVMIGAFGEVYVLDWGIAVSLGEDAEGRFPLARQQRSPAGTPIYMAPEMALPSGDALSLGSDVFLLAGLLFRILAGRPPRHGKSVAEIIGRINQPIVVPESWPDDLRELLAQGFALQPEERPTVADFRRSVEEHLRRRDVLRLVEQAVEGARRLRMRISEGGERMAIYDQFGACRFGLQEALGRWPDLDAARDAMESVHREMVEYELTSGDHRSARVHLAGMREPPGALVARIEALEAEQLAQERQLQAFERDADRDLGARARVGVLIAMLSVWAGGPVLLPLIGIPPSFSRSTGMLVVQFAVTAICFAASYRTVFKTTLNRGVMKLLMLQPLLCIPAFAAAASWGLSIDQAAVLEFWVSIIVVTIGAATLEMAVMPGAVFLALVGGVMIARPEWVRMLTVPALLVFVVNVGVVWWRKRHDGSLL